MSTSRQTSTLPRTLRRGTSLPARSATPSGPRVLRRASTGDGPRGPEPRSRTTGGAQRSSASRGKPSGSGGERPRQGTASRPTAMADRGVARRREDRTPAHDGGPLTLDDLWRQSGRVASGRGASSRASSAPARDSARLPLSVSRSPATCRGSARGMAREGSRRSAAHAAEVPEFTVRSPSLDGAGRPHGARGPASLGQVRGRLRSGARA